MRLPYQMFLLAPTLLSTHLAGAGDVKAHVTPHGLRIDEDCFSLTNMTDESARAAADKWVKEAFDSVTGKCATKYPELGGYFADWREFAGHALIVCSKRSSGDLEAVGINLGSAGALGMAVLGVRSEGRRNVRKTLKARAWWSPPRKSGEALVLIPADEFKRGLEGYQNGSDADFRDTLIHELLHSTSINNQGSKHSKLSGSYDEKNVCAENQTADHVYVVASLCSGVDLTNEPADAALFRRMESCSPVDDRTKACVDIFTDQLRFSKLRLMTRSEPISQKNARSLCGRIYDAGYCKRERASTGETYSKSRLAATGDAVTARLAQLLPEDRRDIPAAVIKAYPDLEKVLSSPQITDSACFRKTLERKADGGLRLSSAIAVPNNFQLRSRPLALAGEFLTRSYLEATVTFDWKYSSYPECADENGRLLRDALKELQARTNEAADSLAFRRLALPRFTGTLEAYGDYVQYSAGAYVSRYNTKDQAFRQLLGAGLYDEYLGRLSADHFESPDFACEPAGMSPFASAYAMTGTLKSVNAPATAPACAAAP